MNVCQSNCLVDKLHGSDHEVWLQLARKNTKLVWLLIIGALSGLLETKYKETKVLSSALKPALAINPTSQLVIVKNTQIYFNIYFYYLREKMIFFAENRKYIDKGFYLKNIPCMC